LIEWTDDFLQILVLDVQVDECGLNTGVAQQLLDGEKIGARF
jgi:hypothetical protein